MMDEDAYQRELQRTWRKFVEDKPDANWQTFRAGFAFGVNAAEDEPRFRAAERPQSATARRLLVLERTVHMLVSGLGVRFAKVSDGPFTSNVPWQDPEDDAGWQDGPEHLR